MKVLFKKGTLLLFAMMCSLTSYNATACGQEPFLAGMCVFAGNFAPRNYLLAQGQILPINQNQSLYSLLGTTYGGDGRTSFALPDMRGRVAISRGQGAGLSDYQLGEKGGLEVVTLSVAQTPNHTHTATTTVTATVDNDIDAGSNISMKAIASTANNTDPSGNALAIINARRSGYYTNAVPDVAMATEAATVTVDISETVVTSNTTIIAVGGQSHENRMPYIAMNWIIAIQGLFPSRN